MSFNKKAYFLIGFFYIFVFTGTAQDQRIADSLSYIYKTDTLKGEAKLLLLQNLSFNEINDNTLALKYAEELISLSTQTNNSNYQFQGYFRKGSTKRIMGDLDEAIEAFFKSAEIAKSVNNTSREGNAYGAVADIYSNSDNHSNAMLYYEKAISTLRNSNDTIALASYIMNAGDDLFSNKKYDSALVYFQESGEIFEKADYIIGKAYNLGNTGMVYAEQGKDGLAEANINEAIAILEKQEDYYPISVYLTYMSDIYLRKKNFSTALAYANQSLELATTYGLKEQIGDANFKLAELYEEKGNFKAAYRHHKDHIKYRDSVVNLKNVQAAADERTEFEVAQKQTELDLLDQQRKNQQIIAIATVFLIGLLAFGLYRRNKFVNRTKKIIENERDRSDSLLLNILPEETATELKETGAVKAKKYDATTVLFTDFKGFTSYSEKLSPEALVETVGFYFSKFDDIIEKHGLEKIKTIGDAYMCVGGLHGNKENHASRMVQAAFEIADFVEETKKDASATELTFDIRIGINTGPVVAGVVGTKKFAYDIWGDTVNVAARMESMSEPGKINISENTHDLIKNKFDCDYRGEIDVKNRGKMKMYFVNTLKNSV